MRQAEGPTPLERAWREERARVVATLARRLGDLQLAEDAVQEAFATATIRCRSMASRTAPVRG